MLDRLILHLGMGKTGSKSIQAFLHANRSWLSRDGYIAFGPNDIVPCPQKNLSDTARLHKAIDGVTRGIADAKARSLIWSLEGFATRQFLSDPARLDAVRTRLPAAEVRTIVYLRRQDHFAVSAYLQWNVVNKSYRGPVQSFDARYPSLYGEPLGTPVADTNLNYHALLAPWAEACGADTMRVRPFESEQLTGGDLLQDFRDAAGLPDRPYTTDIPRQNQTFHRELTDLMGLYGSVFEGPVGAAELIHFVRSFGHDEFFEQPFFSKFELPPATRLRILQDCAEFNARVAREFLGRADGQLFHEPWPDADAPYREYTGLTPEKYLPILLHVLKKQQQQINFLLAQRKRTEALGVWARLRRSTSDALRSAWTRLAGR